MSLIKLNDRAVKDVTQFGSISSLGSLTHISTATASASASIEFTSGIDSTYKEYVFYFVNMHPQTEPPSTGARFSFQGSTDSGSNYNTTITSTHFKTQHGEDGSAGEVNYQSSHDLAQSTSFQRLNENLGNDNDQCLSGYLHLFNPSSTTFVKHFMAVTNETKQNDRTQNCFVAGYFNTTSAIDAIQFKMESGNIDAGQILLFGVN
jgi:hypothetical protein